ncbi:blood vessel epicardial substance-like [Varroa jacobsoni]|uniref:POPDC1-3 domain-containing protein n=1 Tax=Varroa destructor TaxID=109461 RepID=A0A7M7KDR3_VARDE|nr:blood vessel epicardial substance-like [Varroa destructor]XP_022665282.1 blood vessel epicardial substance-like [Varroa destructor]XP_022686168.1 blood vessel epicardial substance-like [Varroa jacobsoni]
MAFMDNLPCQAGWLPTNHILFHFANVCLFLSYAVPSDIQGLLYLRVVLFFASLFFALWGWLVLCALDTFMWNAIFTVMNAVQIYLAYQMLPRKIRFIPVIERLHEKLFAPLKVSKEEFKPVYNAATEVIYFNEGELFELSYFANAVCLVIRGQIAMISNKKPVKEYYQYEFINPSSYFAPAPIKELSQSQEVHLTAVCTSTIILIWRREELHGVLSQDPHLQVVFDCLVYRQMAQERTSTPVGTAPPHQSRTQ